MVFQSDGNTFDLRRLQAHTKVQTDVLDELLYAYDMDNAWSEAKTQRAMDNVITMISQSSKSTRTNTWKSVQ